MEIQTHNRMPKTDFAENCEFCYKKWHTNLRRVHCQQYCNVNISVCGVAERSPETIRDKCRALNRADLNHPDQLATHILETSTTGEDLRVTRLTGNSGVSFRSRSDCWSQLPIQCGRLRSQSLLDWVWIYPEILFIIECQYIKRMRSFPTNSVPSQHSRQSGTYKTEQPFLSNVQAA